MQWKASYLTGLRSAPGWASLLVFIYKLIGHSSNVDFVVSASGNSHLTAIWNWLQTSAGEVTLAIFGCSWLAIVVWVRGTSGSSSSAPEKGDDMLSGGIPHERRLTIHRAFYGMVH